MSWIILIISGVFEAVWATALDKPAGFTKFWLSVVFFVALLISMGASPARCALREIPTGTD